MVLIGSIIAYVGTLEALKADNPDFLPAEGQELKSRDYKHLARALGVTGETIRLPDLRGRFLKGVEGNDEVLQTGGSTSHVHSASCSEKHGDLNFGAGVTGALANSVHKHNITVHESSNEPPFSTVRWIVRVR